MATSQNDMTLVIETLLKQLHSELERLLLQRAQTIQHIGIIKKTIVGLATLFGSHVLNEELRHLIGVEVPRRRPGLNQACRMALMNADESLSAHDVLDELRRQSPDLLIAHRDPLASVTTVLNRLVNYGEAQRVAVGHRGRLWQWRVSHPAIQGAGEQEPPVSCWRSQNEYLQDNAK